MISGLPSSFSREQLPVSVPMIHRYYAPVRPLEDVHVGGTAIAFSHRPGVLSTPGVSEVSRFSCMKFLGVSGVYDYAGLTRGSR